MGAGVVEVELDVLGYPAPQGSKKAWVNKATGKAQMSESSGPKIGLWRQDVKGAVQEFVSAHEDWEPLSGPLQAELMFYFARPKGHYRSGRNAALLRDSAPLFPANKAFGDVDKLIRATLDAMNVAGLFWDDSQVAGVSAWKRFADARQPGAHIIVRCLEKV